MIRAIRIGKYLTVQGRFVGKAPAGRITIRVGDKTFTGNPIPRRAA
ncbi:hypothetical protein [Roseicitreum antarcticum]|uniref:Uncharacterized protein n=1 Tax=Roseicitreum antarcticum TaxID=564137 RepID=A0A1H3AZ95_9RHOB|nr:hypothetical protein [Roseicitreum antarcticum]SDX34444.1 hypothetical protein SAMN04488238_107173 [Roseicitreum antarcticum]